MTFVTVSNLQSRGLDEGQAESVIKRFDTNGDSKLSKEELITMKETVLGIIGLSELNIIFLG